MKPWTRIAAAGLALGFATEAPAQTAPRRTVVVPMPMPMPPAVPMAPVRRAYTPAEKAIGVEIGRMLNTQEDTAALIERDFSTAMREQMVKDPNYQTMESMYPGISEAILTALVDELRRMVDREMPTLWDRLGTAYAETFDAAELGRLQRFYAGPAGQALIRNLYDRADVKALAKQGYENPDKDLTTSDLNVMLPPSARASAVASLSPDARKEVLALSISPIGPRLLRLNPRLRQIAVDWGNELQKNNEPHIMELLMKVVTDYAAKAEKGQKTHPVTEPKS